MSADSVFASTGLFWSGFARDSLLLLEDSFAASSTYSQVRGVKRAKSFCTHAPLAWAIPPLV
jgi:hypothetical protein